MRRLKVTDGEGWYHVFSRAACEKGVYPLDKELCRRHFMTLIKYYSRAYFCDIAAFCIMGNHYHLVVKFDIPRKLSQEELWQRALLLYPRSKKYLKLWDQKKWQVFEQRLFNLSEFMRNIQSAFAIWYNKTFKRHGTFWADRFKSVLLGDEQAVLDCMLYVELNPVRAGLCKVPDDYQACSFYLRSIKTDGWLLALSKILDVDFTEYRMALYYRGNITTKDTKSTKGIRILITDEVIEKERERGFETTGMYRKRLRYFVDGMALGSEAFIRQQLEQVRERGEYLRRINPIKQLHGIHLTLREQRGHAVSF
jgi:REP element-mobilizing transposase RayT